MPDFFSGPYDATVPPPLLVLIRLVVAMLLGGVVSFIYRRSRAAHEIVPSFSVTLVLLAILIAMVTQVIGDNVARAFSLVGALSIVRFRTVVRDTQDTAYVIFAVAVGMAVGASNPSVALGGIAVVSIAAFVMKRSRGSVILPEDLPFLLQVRVGLGHDINTLLGATLDQYLGERRLASVTTAGKGMALEVAYRTTLRTDEAAGDLVTALNRIEGVQSVVLQRIGPEQE